LGNISFPRAIPHALSETNVFLLFKAETAKADSERAEPLRARCPGTLEDPTATPAGTLCVYTGLEEEEGEFQFGPVNGSGSKGCEATGCALAFVHEVGVPILEEQGTWAVDAG
jgi:hypothetical protein